jgi:thioredoxin-dependent peroxiredoxin
MKTFVLALTIAIAPMVTHAALLQAGDTFPTWSLRDQTGATVTSTSLTGTTYLVWFYPKAMTPGCTAEGGGLRDNFDAFKAKGVEVLGVSFDTPAENAAFVAKEKFPFRLLSDTDRALAVAVGAADTKDQPVARRISYLVGPDGKVKVAYGTVVPQTHAQDVLGSMSKE